MFIKWPFSPNVGSLSQQHKNDWLSAWKWSWYIHKRRHRIECFWNSGDIMQLRSCFDVEAKGGNGYTCITERRTLYRFSRRSCKYSIQTKIWCWVVFSVFRQRSRASGKKNFLWKTPERAGRMGKQRFGCWCSRNLGLVGVPNISVWRTTFNSKGGATSSIPASSILLW